MARHIFVHGLHRLAIVGLAGFGLFAALPAAPSAGPVVALFPPWWSSARVFSAAAAGGAPLRMGRLPGAVVIMPDTEHGLGRLREAGALLFLNPNGFIGCGRKQDSRPHDA